MPPPWLRENEALLLMSLAVAGSCAAAIMPCGCEGISLSSSVTVSDPPVSPRSCRLRPGPWPGCMGARPWRSGSAKFDLPSPPYVVPSREKSAVFWDRGSSCPSHHAQPLGAKLNGKIRISATNGSAMARLLCRAREDPEQGDDEVDAEVGLEVVVWLASARRRHARRVHVGVRRQVDVWGHVLRRRR